MGKRPCGFAKFVVNEKVLLLPGALNVGARSLRASLRPVTAMFAVLAFMVRP